LVQLDLNVADYLPFGGNARTVESVVCRAEITNSSGSTIYENPSVVVNAGSNDDLIQLKWPTSCSGKVGVTARMDKPV